MSPKYHHAGVGFLIVAMSVPALGAEILWVPLEASGSYTINGNEIVLDGSGQTVTLDLKLAAWDPESTGSPELGSWQGTVDSTGYLGANATPLSGVDLLPVGWPDEAYLGGYQILERCFDQSGGGLHDEPCGNPAQGPFVTVAECQAAGGLFCPPNAAFVLSCCDPVAAVSRASLNFSWGATPGPNAPGGAVDDGTERYGGTLVLDVPFGANGTYTIAFVDDTDLTFMSAFDGSAMLVEAIPALITVLCVSNGECDDLDACTADVCEGDGLCSHALNYNPSAFCCDSNTGSTIPINDGNDCTDDVCNADGSVDHTPLASGVTCGGPPTGGCDAQNTCDGAGICTDNSQPAGTSCLDGSDTECTDPDTCDGTGTCLPNHAPSGTSCGDPGDTDCDNPDTCNGAGGCSLNHENNGTVCDDDLFCTTGETCSNGECTGGGFTCDDGVGCTDDSCDEDNDLCDNVPNDVNCDNGQYCDGVEVCDPVNDCVVQAGTVPDCNDLVGCTVDSCNEANDVCVNTPIDSACNNGQFCDGVEVCDPVDDCVIEGGSVPDCDDSIDCTIDSCDEGNDRCVHLTDDGLCPDDGLFCNGPEVCDAVAGCVPSGCPCGASCETSCDEDLDICLCDTPLVDGAGSRYLRVTTRPADSIVPQAIVITAYCDGAPQRYVGAPVPFDSDGDGAIDSSVARIVSDPIDAAFLTPAEWGDPVYIVGEEIGPTTPYQVQVDCGSPGAPSLSDAAEASTWVWGDVNRNNFANFGDIQLIVFAFQGAFLGTDIPAVDLGGVSGIDQCVPQQSINFVDIQFSILAFQSVDLEDIGCVHDCRPCIAEFTCNDRNACTADSCASDGACVHEPIYDTATFCCNPANASLSPISDADPCTIDTCNPGSGAVTHTPITCSDGMACTADECVGGICVFTDYNDISCSDNSDCPPDSAGCQGHCTCPDTLAARMEWQPVDADVAHNIVGNEIFIPAGGAIVELELLVSGWAPNLLILLQGSIDGEGSYSSGTAGTLVPLGWPDDREQGAFIIADRCTINQVFNPDGAHCSVPFDCLSNEFCIHNQEFVLPEPLLSAVQLVTINYRWGAVIRNDSSVSDDGQRWYFATLIIDVPPDARGTFTLEFDPDLTQTFMINDTDAMILPLTLVPGKITVTGS